jgi:hypothetical protein
MVQIMNEFAQSFQINNQLIANQLQSKRATNIE